ncbi:MAG: ATP synthase F1 subunit gamma [Clostridia bacterium]|nr:ATP synthase F1 subunit gamma [Clostridia bacterium]
MAGVGTRDIKRKIKSVNSTMQITKAMELVSTAKLKKNKDRLEMTRPYYETVLKTVGEIMRDADIEEHEYLSNREISKSLYIVLAGDRGLCGGYNINAIKAALAHIEDPSKALIIPVGKKAFEFFKRNEFEIEKEYLGISERPEFADARKIARLAMKLYSQEKVDEVHLVYTRMESTISQVATRLKLVPLDVEAVAQEVAEVADEKASFEPSAEVVLDYLIPKSIESTIFGGLIESSASEQAARRNAMENATDNAEEMIEELTLSFNQARQSAITQEITEIVGGAEALK